MGGSVVLWGQVKALSEPVDVLGVLCMQNKGLITDRLHTNAATVAKLLYYSVRDKVAFKSYCRCMKDSSANIAIVT